MATTGRRGGRASRSGPGPGAVFGPRKKRRTGAAPPRFTSHKKRAAWFQARGAWPQREAPVTALVRERARVRAQLAPLAGAAQWTPVGPTNVGGRMTCVVCLPNKPDTIWAGAAGGGIWKSDDGGRSWRALWHDEPTLNIGSLALDPTNPATIYCGTGEANLSADSYPGVGLFRSLDGGETWHLLAPAETAGIPTRIGCIAIDPFDPSHILLGGVTHEYGSGHSGLYVSRDGGLSFARDTFPGHLAYRCHAVQFHPTRRDTLFATINARGTRSGVWRSTNGGKSWTQLTNGLPGGDAFGRASLTISPSQPNTMYMLAEDTSDNVLGVFKTTNGGATWTNVVGGKLADEGQMSYGNTIAVHPADPDHVLCGGVDLYLTRDGGKTWKRVTRWDAVVGDTNYAHADHHCLLMPPAQPGLVYDMNDGGMDVSFDGGLKWQNRSNGLAVTMFYDVDVAQSNRKVFGGGTQDNGTRITFDDMPGGFPEITGGDGGWTIFDPRDAGHYYTTWQNMGIHRFRNTTSHKDVSPPAPEDEQNRVWMVFLDMDPRDSKTVFAGGLRVWRTTNDGVSWTAVSGILDGSAITAVEIAQADSDTIYVGTENGGIFRSLNRGKTWSGNLSGPVPGVTVTRLFASPSDAKRVYATVANFGASHVFRSNDGGSTWMDIDRSRLPGVPHHAIAIPTSRPSTVYVCSDAGVHVSTDSGASWKDLTRNLPTSPVVDLVYHEKDKALTAATYGRSLWRLKV